MLNIKQKSCVVSLVVSFLSTVYQAHNPVIFSISDTEKPGLFFLLKREKHIGWINIDPSIVLATRASLGFGYRGLSDQSFWGMYGDAAYFFGKANLRDLQNNRKGSFWMLKVGGEYATHNYQATLQGYWKSLNNDLSNFCFLDMRNGLSLRLSSYLWKNPWRFGQLNFLTAAAITQVDQVKWGDIDSSKWHREFALGVMYESSHAIIEGKWIWDTLTATVKPRFSLGFALKASVVDSHVISVYSHRGSALSERAIRPAEGYTPYDFNDLIAWPEKGDASVDSDDLDLLGSESTGSIISSKPGSERAVIFDQEDSASKHVGGPSNPGAPKTVQSWIDRSGVSAPHSPINPPSLSSTQSVDEEALSVPSGSTLKKLPEDIVNKVQSSNPSRSPSPNRAMQLNRKEWVMPQDINSDSSSEEENSSDSGPGKNASKNPINRGVEETKAFSTPLHGFPMQSPFSSPETEKQDPLESGRGRVPARGRGVGGSRPVRGGPANRQTSSIPTLAASPTRPPSAASLVTSPTKRPVNSRTASTPVVSGSRGGRASPTVVRKIPVRGDSGPHSTQHLRRPSSAASSATALPQHRSLQYSSGQRIRPTTPTQSARDPIRSPTDSTGVNTSPEAEQASSNTPRPLNNVSTGSAAIMPGLLKTIDYRFNPNKSLTFDPRSAEKPPK